MTFELNAEFLQAVRDFRRKYGDEACREAIAMYLVGVKHAVALVDTLAIDAQHDLVAVLSEPMPQEN
jgi:hypothetical protein